MLDAFARQLHEKARRGVVVGAPEERAVPCVREVHAILRARDPHVGEPALLFDALLVLERSVPGEHTLFHPRHEHDRELQSLHGVHRDERRRGLRLDVLVDVRDEGDLFEERRQLLLARIDEEVLSERPQLEHVAPALLALVGAVLEVRVVSRQIEDLVDERREVALGDLGAQALHEPAERGERLALALRDRLDPVSLTQGLGQRDAPLARIRLELGLRLGAEPPRRRVDDPREREGVLRVPQEPEVRQHVLHLASLIEGDTADHLVGEAERAERVLDGPRLRVRPVQDGDVAHPVRLTFALETLDLPRDELSLVLLVVRLQEDDLGPAGPVGPEALFLPRGVVPDDRPRRVEDPLRRTVVLLELHHGRARVVALEVEDVPHVRSAPAEHALVVVADDRQVLVEAGQVTEEDVLGAIRVLVLVDEDVAVAVLPALEGPIARLEQAAGQEQEVVEVDRVVLAEELVVALPHDRGDAVELAAGIGGQVGRPLELVLRGGDGGGDGAWGEDALARPGVGHRLPEDRALVRLVVDRERAVEPHERALPPEQPGTERVERPDRQLAELLAADQAFEPLLHLAGGLVREGDGEDRTRRHAEVADQVRDPVREHAGLARACAGKDQQGAVAMRHGGALLEIEGIEDGVGQLDSDDGGFAGGLPPTTAVDGRWMRGGKNARGRGHSGGKFVDKSVAGPSERTVCFPPSRGVC